MAVPFYCTIKLTFPGSDKKVSFAILMQDFKKNTAALILLVLITVPVFFSIAFIYEEAHIKEKACQRLKESSLITITVPASEVSWIKEGKEILIRGRFFDVRSCAIEKDHVTLTGVYDLEEDALLEELKRYNGMEEENSSTLAGLVLKFLSATDYFSPVQFLFHTDNGMLTNACYPSYTASICSVLHQPKVKPPRAGLS